MTRVIAYVVGAVALYAASARASDMVRSATEGSKEVLKAADLYRLQAASNATISPDGRWIVYTRSAPDIMTDRMQDSLWLIDVRTGSQRQLSADGSGISWSPLGDKVAFIAHDRADRSQIFVQAPTEDVPSQLTHESKGVGAPVWSHDGRWIAYTVAIREPTAGIGAPVAKPAGAQWADPLIMVDWPHYLADGEGFLPKQTHQIVVVTTTDGAGRQVTSSPNDVVGNPAWSADDKALVFADQENSPEVTPHIPFTHLREVNVATKVQRALTQGKVYDRDAVVSPDGRLIAFVRYEFNGKTYDRYRLMTMMRDGSRLRDLSAALDRDVAPPIWAPDSRAVMARFDDGGIGHIGRFDLDGTTTRLVDRVGGDEQFSMSLSGDIAYLDASHTSPADVWLKPVAGAARPLTKLNAAALEKKVIATVKPLEVHSSFDGKSVGTWIVLPPGYRAGHRYPTILSIHGGPHGSVGDDFQFDDQLFAAQGYVVVLPNYRGSTSYGAAFAGPDMEDHWPDVGYRDLMSAMDAGVSEGFADPKRLFVTGGSAGGMLAAWIEGSDHRFSAAVVVKPIVDVASQVLSSDQYRGFIGEQKAMPWDDHGALWKMSPLSLVANVNTPTMVMVGELDRRTPLTQTLAYFNALRLRGVPSKLVVVPGAGHDDLRDRISQHAAIELETLNWFGSHGGIPSSTD